MNNRMNAIKEKGFQMNFNDFKSEKELRAMYWDTDGRYSSTPEGLLFKVDLNELIEFVYVAPFSMPQYRDIIEDLIMKYGLRKEVIKSGI